MRKSRCEDFIRIAFALVLCRISRCGLFFSKLEILSKKNENYFLYKMNFYQISTKLQEQLLKDFFIYGIGIFLQNFILYFNFH